jgi:hypothetical protein
MTNGLKISVEEFESLPVDKQRVALYRAFTEQIIQCDGRFKTIEKRKWVSAAASAGGGIAGGFLAMITKMAFWK